MSKDTGGPAFPSRGGMMFYIPKEAEGTIESAITQIDKKHEGLSMRDYFAAKAMASAWTDPATLDAAKRSGDFNFFHTCAVISYKMADAMLAERAK